MAVGPGIAAALKREIKRELLRRRLEALVAVMVPLGMVLIWELLSRLGVLDIRFFSAPSLIAQQTWAFLVTGELVDNLKFTLMRVLLGFALGASVGTACGIFMGLFEKVRSAIFPIISSIYPIPKIALLPLLLMSFGYSEPTRFIPGALSAFFLTSVSTLAGVAAVRKIYLDVAKNMGASQFNIYTTVAIPGALPMIFAGVRLGWGMAMITTVSVELVASKNGLGFMMWNAWELFAISQMFVAIVVLAAVGLISFAIIDSLQQRVMRWKPC